MATTFAYSDDEGKKIITSASLLDEETVDPQDGLDHRHLLQDLKRLREKDIKLDLNSITLSDYWRKGLIPRGLRIKKFPVVGSKDKGEFKLKWEAILSKCSFDLMLLLIEEAKKDKVSIQTEIDKLNMKLDELRSAEFTNSLAKLNDNLIKFKEHLKQEKLRKFKRDERDYKENKVYFWQTPRSNAPLHQEPQRRGARTVSFNFTSEEEDQDDQPTTSSTLMERPSGNDQTPGNGGRNKKLRKDGVKNVREGDVRNPPHKYGTRIRQRTR